MQRRLGRELTLGRSIVLVIGAVALIVLIAKRRARDEQQTSVPEEAGEARTGNTGENIQTHVGELPVEDYDSLNVHQVTQKLGELSVEELEQLRDYEANNKNRRSIMQRLDTRIRARQGRSS